MKIRYRNLAVEDPLHKKKLLNAVEKVLDHGVILLGPEVGEFEDQIAKRCGMKFGIGVNSGTDALFLALRAIGIGPGDEVITTPLSWIATTNAIAMTGATPVFVDIGEDLNINPDLIEQSITERTRAILPVHFTGRMCRMKNIMDIADRHNLTVVEDAAQAFGAHIDGQPAGSFGRVNCFSMNPMKVLEAYGEAGCVVTNDTKISDRICSLRYAGTINKENCHTPSLNGRIDTIQAAMMLVNLEMFDQKISRLRQIASIYDKALEGIVGCPGDDGSFQVYYSYTVTTPQRENLISFLAQKGVETKIQHPVLMPFHDAYKEKQKGVSLPMAEKKVKEIVCLPNHDKMTDDQVSYVINQVQLFFEKQ